MVISPLIAMIKRLVSTDPSTSLLVEVSHLRTPTYPALSECPGFVLPCSG